MPDKKYVKKIFAALMFLLLISPELYPRETIRIISMDSDSLLTENEALDLVYELAKRDSIYSERTKIECLDFFVENDEPIYYDITVREKHGDGCPGDPDFAPRVDTFRIFKDTKKIYWYYLPDDKYILYSEYLKNRHKKKSN